MEKSSSFEELIVWQKAHAFTMDVYELTEAFPTEEIYALTSRFHRAAFSNAANIAEGYRKKGQKESSTF